MISVCTCKNAELEIHVHIMRPEFILKYLSLRWKFTSSFLTSEVDIICVPFGHLKTDSSKDFKNGFCSVCISFSLGVDH